jgi:hypothetical protein
MAANGNELLECKAYGVGASSLDAEVKKAYATRVDAAEQQVRSTEPFEQDLVCLELHIPGPCILWHVHSAC